jgi:hypothetical protein
MGSTKSVFGEACVSPEIELTILSLIGEVVNSDSLCRENMLALSLDRDALLEVEATLIGSGLSVYLKPPGVSGGEPSQPLG